MSTRAVYVTAYSEFTRAPVRVQVKAWLKAVGQFNAPESVDPSLRNRSKPIDTSLPGSRALGDLQCLSADGLP